MVELKSNFGFPYTAINGNMYSMLTKGGHVGIRLPTEERAAFLKKFKATMHPGPLGPSKEYVSVPDDLLKDTETLGKYLELSHKYASALKPKPQRKARKTSAN